MTNRTAETSPLVYARVAGILYLILAIASGFTFFLLAGLIVPGDASATVNNILASESLFRIGFVSDLIGGTTFILLVLVLYKLLKPVNKNVAVLMVVFVIVMVPIAMLNRLNQFAALLLLSGAEYLTVFETDQLHALVLLFLDLLTNGINIIRIFFGVISLRSGSSTCTRRQRFRSAIATARLASSWPMMCLSSS